MTTIEKIKAEIERRITNKTFGGKLELIDLLSFLSDLEESEKPINQKFLDEEIEKEYTKLPPMLDIAKIDDYTIIKAFARHFYELGCRRTEEKYETI